MAKDAAGLRKRQQIVKANRVMFLYIAGVSVVVGFSLVLIIFLVQKIWFGEKVIAEKLNTVSVLEKNLAIAPELKNNVRVLNTNEDLKAARMNESNPALQSVLDALPADANSAAMASSLQNKLLNGIPGVTIDTLQVQPVSGVEVSTDGAGALAVGANSDPTMNTINFSFSVSTQSTGQDGLRQILTRLEKSIRPFTITSLTVESQGSRVSMTVNGVGYYEPAQTVELKDKVVRP